MAVRDLSRIPWLADALRDQGLDIVVMDGWGERGYDSLVSPLHGCVFHHTASPISVEDAQAARTVTFGRTGLPGPIANAMVGRSGKVWVIAAGKANHAGEGGPWRQVPQDDGNRFLFGLEVVNNGIGEPWSETVLDSVDRVFAAVLEHEGLDASAVIGHKEWTTRKIDPSLSMDGYRKRLAQFMDAPEYHVSATKGERTRSREFDRISEAWDWAKPLIENGWRVVWGRRAR